MEEDATFEGLQMASKSQALIIAYRARMPVETLVDEDEISSSKSVADHEMMEGVLRSHCSHLRAMSACRVQASMHTLSA